jgi:hypothetical protein
MLGIYRVAAQLVVSRVVLSSKDLVKLARYSVFQTKLNLETVRGYIVLLELTPCLVKHLS